ncbi:chitotriosidase-1-like [Argopecten irradians]|uniref:chitotriosidase-1-like n=1 Tax=Argopecten irradians TaxID=31199 RepID=UPI003712227A
MNYIRLLFVLSLVCLCTCASGHRLVCTYDAWAATDRTAKVVPADIDPFLCTHIVFAFAKIKKSAPKIYRRVVSDPKQYIPFTNLTLVNPELKALIMIQEEPNSGMSYEEMASDPGNRATFIQSVIDFCRDKGFDGISFQWKYANATLFQTMSQEFRAAFDAENSSSTLILVANMAAHTIEDIDAYYDKYTVKTTVIDNYDFINLETFDFYDSSNITVHHSRLMMRNDSEDADKFLNMKAAAEYYTYLGVPKYMISIGFATYGSGYTLTSASDYGMGAPVTGISREGNYTNVASNLAYYEICLLLSEGTGAMYYDFGVPYFVYDDQWIGYDNPTSFKEKAEWVVNEGYGGAYVYSLTFDDYSQNCTASTTTFPLINTVKDVFVEAATPKLYRRVCYFSTWSKDRPGIGAFDVNDIDPTLCTHLIVAFAEVSDLSELVPTNVNHTDIYQRATALKSLNPDLKVLLSVGGWTQASQRFSHMVSGPKRRRAFANSTISLLRANNFDGLDIAWLYPTQRGGRDSDKKNFGVLLKLLRQTFKSEVLTGNMAELLLTAAVAADQENIDYAYDVDVMSKALDFISIQTYDMRGPWDMETGHHSQLRAFPYQTGPDANLNMQFAGDYWHMLGMDKDKINIGFPMFGRGFNVSDMDMDWRVGLAIQGPSRAGPYTGEDGFLAYYELCDLQGTEKNLGDALIKYGDDNLWIGYEDVNTLERKTTWLMYEGYGGAMIWSLDLDDFRANCSNSASEFPLANMIKDILVNSSGGLLPPVDLPTTTYPGSSTTMEDTTTPIPSTTQEAFVDCTTSPTGGPYPNPANCRTFYKCSHGVPHLYNCPSPLSYDRAHRVCNWDHHTNC